MITDLPIDAIFSVAAVGPEAWYSHHEYINGDTHQRVFNNSSGSPINFRP
jgi:hypothetical protein